MRGRYLHQREEGVHDRNGDPPRPQGQPFGQRFPDDFMFHGLGDLDHRMSSVRSRRRWTASSSTSLVAIGGIWRPLSMRDELQEPAPARVPWLDYIADGRLVRRRLGRRAGAFGEQREVQEL